MKKYILYSLIIMLFVGCSDNQPSPEKQNLEQNTSDIDDSQAKMPNKEELDTTKYYDKDDFIKHAKVGRYETKLDNDYKEVLTKVEDDKKERRETLDNLKKEYGETESNFFEAKKYIDIVTDKIIETMQDINDLNSKTQIMDNTIKNLEAIHKKQINNLKDRISHLTYATVVYGKGSYVNNVKKELSIKKLELKIHERAIEEYGKSNIEVYKKVIQDQNGEYNTTESKSQTKNGMSKELDEIFIYDHYDYEQGKSIIEAFYSLNVGTAKSNKNDIKAMNKKNDADKDNYNDTDKENYNDTDKENYSTTIMNAINFSKMVNKGDKNGILFSKKDRKMVKEIVNKKIQNSSRINSERETNILAIEKELKDIIYASKIEIDKQESRKKEKEKEKLVIVQEKLPSLFKKLNEGCNSYTKKAESRTTAFNELNNYMTEPENYIEIPRFSEFSMEDTLSVDILTSNLIEAMLEDINKSDNTFYTSTQLISSKGKIKETSSSSVEEGEQPNIEKTQYLFKTHRTTIDGNNNFGVGLLFTMKNNLSDYDEPSYNKNCFKEKFKEATTDLKKMVILSKVKFSIKKDSIVFDKYFGSIEQFKYVSKNNNKKSKENRIYFNKTPFEKDISAPIYNHSYFTNIKFVKEGESKGYFIISTRKNVSIKSNELKDGQIEFKIK